MKTTKIALALAVAAGLSGCNGVVAVGGAEQEAPYGNGGKIPGIQQPSGGGGMAIDPNTGMVDTDGDGVGDTLPEDVNPQQPAARCDVGTTYKGFDGLDLNRTRLDELQMVDRSRMKPYSALSGEFQTALNNTPALLATLGPTFGEPAARWFEEPEASAISVFSAYRAGFQGCLTMIGTEAKYGTAPTAATAQTECTAMATKFWSRTPGQAEVASCVNVATVDSATIQDSRRRWAHTCAAVMAAAGFLTF